MDQLNNQGPRYTAHLIARFRKAMAAGGEVLKDLEMMLTSNTSPRLNLASYAAVLILIPIIVETYRIQGRKIPTIAMENLNRRAQALLAAEMNGRPIEDLDVDEFKPEGGAGRWRVSHKAGSALNKDAVYRFTPGVPSLQALQAMGFANAR